MNFSKILDFLSKNKRQILFFAFLLFAFSPEYSFAADNTFAKSLDFITGMAQFIVLVYVGLSGIITMVVSWFLSPEWVTGSFFGINTYLKDIRILVSNVVYFIFAFLLIWIAFMNILGKGDKWELKQALPKFIIGVFIVPFSWFFVQFIVSITSILTISILTLPSDTFSGYANDIKEKNMCSEYTVNFSALGKAVEGIGKTSTGSENKEEIIQCTSESGEKDRSIEDVLMNNPIGILNIYTYGVMKLDGMDKITGEQVANLVKDSADLFGKTLFDIIFAGIYLILLIALLLALFIRGIRLWIYMMLSPVFGLMYFFDKKEGGDGAFANFNLKEFLSLALVPVYVAAALSFGLLFLVVVSGGMRETTGDFSSVVEFKFEDDKSSMKVGDGAGSLKITMTGGSNISKKAGDTIGGALDGAKGMVGMLILRIFGIVILWMAVMSALKSSKITYTVIQPIESFGKSMGDLMMKAPTYAPIFPGGVSAEGLSRISKMPQNALEKRVSSNISPFQDKFDRAFRVKTIPVDKIAGLRTAWNDGIQTDEELKKIQKELRDIAGTYGTNTAQYQQLLNEFNSALKSDKTSGSIKSLAKDGKIFDGAGKLTDDGVRLLHDSQYDQNSGTRAIQRSYATKVWQAGGSSSDSEVKEGDAGYVSGEMLEVMKDVNKQKVKMGVKSGDKIKEIDVDINDSLKDNGIRFAITDSSKDDDKKVHFIASINGVGYGLDFESNSVNSFKSTTLNEVSNNLQGDDKKQLIKILDKLTPIQQESLLKEIFPNAKGDISETSIKDFKE